MDWTLVYDVAEDSFQWWLLVIPTLFAVVATTGFTSAARIGGAARGQRARSALVLLVRIGASVVAALAALALLGILLQYAFRRGAVQHAVRGSCDMVEGEVYDHKAAGGGGHTPEVFKVSGVSFEFSQYRHDIGFRHTTPEGGPIRAGLRVRICYLEVPGQGNRILRLWLPREGQRPPPSGTVESTP